MSFLNKPLFALATAIIALSMLASPIQAKKGIRVSERLFAGPWVAKSGIRIAPIYISPSDHSLNFLSLDQASKADVIEVTETGSVNELVVENTGRKPILLLAGEVVTGGKQDRMVGKDMILGPGRTRKISVFCVEHGRWTPQAERHKFKSSSMMADQTIRLVAQTQGGASANQAEVWDQVSRAIDSYKVAAPTQNYQEIKKSEKFRDGESAADYFISAFAKDDGIAGFAVAYNGEVQTLEYFAAPELLEKYRDKLIRSYVTSAFRELEQSSPVRLEEIREFANESLSKETHQYQTDDEMVIESRGSGLQSFELLTPKLKTVHYTRYVAGPGDGNTKSAH